MLEPSVKHPVTGALSPETRVLVELVQGEPWPTRYRLALTLRSDLAQSTVRKCLRNLSSKGLAERTASFRFLDNSRVSGQRWSPTRTGVEKVMPLLSPLDREKVLQRWLYRLQPMSMALPTSSILDARIRQDGLDTILKERGIKAVSKREAPLPYGLAFAWKVRRSPSRRPIILNNSDS